MQSQEKTHVDKVTLEKSKKWVDIVSKFPPQENVKEPKPAPQVQAQVHDTKYNNAQHKRTCKNKKKKKKEHKTLLSEDF